MQLFAFNESDTLVAAAHAVPRHDYVCLECRGVVRLRAGLHRQRHFYHLQLTPSCRLSKKSMEHLQTQIFLQQLIGVSECRLEVPFPGIGRIADVVWSAQRLVFEVQCSPIRAAEIEERNRDYASVGLQVVWLLHTKTFGGMRMTPAERLLRHHPCYFTDINANGEGAIVDRFDCVQSGMRVSVLDDLAVDLAVPQHSQGKTPLKCTAHRLEMTPLYFAGDLVDLSLSQPKSDYILRAKRLELQQSQLTQIPWWTRFLWHPYRMIFRHVLESVSH